MSFKELRQKRWFKIVSNRYVIILFIFTVWMIFFDSNSLMVHRELNEERNKLQDNKEYYQTEIKHDKSIIEGLDDSFALEKFARETYFMKRKDEEVFIIEYQDSTKSK